MRGLSFLERQMSAVLSPCGLYRYRLDRRLDVPVGQLELAADGVYEFRGKAIAFFGINPSTADASKDDATVRKWIGFTKRWGASRFIVGNVFAYRATDVKALGTVEDPFGDDIGDHITDIITEADVLVPCWGNTTKVPPKLQDAFDVLLDALVSSGKPVRCFGLTKAGDPMHPLMLGYDTPLVPWANGQE